MGSECLGLIATDAALGNISLSFNQGYLALNSMRRSSVGMSMPSYKQLLPKHVVIIQ